MLRIMLRIILILVINIFRWTLVKVIKSNESYNLNFGNFLIISILREELNVIFKAAGEHAKLCPPLKWHQSGRTRADVIRFSLFSFDNCETFVLTVTSCVY